MDKAFDLPLIGPVLRILFSERFHVFLGISFALGWVSWILNYFFPAAIFASLSAFLIPVPVALLGLWIVLVLLFVAIDNLQKIRKRSVSPDLKNTDQLLEESFIHGELEVSITFNSSQQSIGPYDSHAYNLSIRGRQSDPVDEEIKLFFEDRTDKKVMVTSGSNFWRRRVIFEARN